MEMTFQQYIDNPLGKKNAVFSQRDVFKAIYTEKFEKVNLREAGKIVYYLYTDKNKTKYIIHIKVPSETVKDFYYDAVICFYSNDAAVISSNSLKDYHVKFFSNDPAFVFTYLRVFLKNDLFFEDMKPKSSKIALTKDPKEKNPYELPGYSKILYFAFLYMKHKNLFNKAVFEHSSQLYDKKKVLAMVDHTDDKLAARQAAGERQAAQIRKEKADERRRQNNTPSSRINSLPTGNANVRRTVTTSNSPSIRTTNKTRTTKTTKRVNKK